PALLEIERPADAVFLHELREAVVRFAAQIGGLDVEAVRLAVGEACANVVVHAYRRSPEPGTIRVRALEQEGRLVVEVRDDGCGPAPRPDSPGMGLGLPLMTRLATELQVLDREPSGTLVRLTFAR
ncbi:MAG: ATP-binding protein, partial [Solirubrobacterales bacterium]|nr:ATP-binding protein [Solirubrobacterales bacterium]